MSKQKNAKRAAYEKKQEAQGKKVVTWIICGLIAIAVIFICSIMYVMS